jgi:hypothetical protein
MSLLTAEQILASRPWPTEEVEVPEWGGSVRVRALSATEIDAFNASIVQQNGKNVVVNRINYRRNLLALSLVNGDGVTRLFTDEAKIVLLGAQPSIILDRLMAVVNRLNAITEEDHEDAVKN